MLFNTSLENIQPVIELFLKFEHARACMHVYVIGYACVCNRLLHVRMTYLYVCVSEFCRNQQHKYVISARNGRHCTTWENRSHRE